MRPRMRAPWWLRAFALVFLVCCGCKSSFSEEKVATLSSQLQTDRASQTNETRTVTQGPETITTRVDEYAIPDVPRAADPGHDGDSGANSLSTTPKEPDRRARPVLVKRTVIVDHRDPVVSQATLEAHAATETKAEAKSASTDDLKKASAPAGLFGGLMALWPLLPVALVGLAIWKRQAILILVKRFFL